MKRISILLLCVSFIFIFNSCSRYNDESGATPTAIVQSPVNETDAPDTKNENNASPLPSPVASTPAEPSVEVGNNNSQNKSEVMGKVELYEGIYFDDRRFGDNIINTYCEVEITNITDTSFDFTVYEVNEPGAEGEKNKKVIFLTNTAVFIDDGKEAAFYGKDYTLNFSFPNYHNAEPIVTDIEISGFEPLEGHDYVNNGIPGHEFG